jgi:hypothetical protein
MRYLLLLLALSAYACGDAAGPSRIPPELVGNWIAQPACIPQCGLTFYSLVNPADSILVTRFVSTRIAIGADGSFELATLPTSPATPPIVGRATAANGELTVTGSDGTRETLRYSVSGALLTVEFAGTFAFESNAPPVPSRARGLFLRH